ncbi:MAG: histidine--tRNA ligase [Coriobacteriales bacterium]|nr:histidine--tRNA ligase [Coriobacteriales bacterium]
MAVKAPRGTADLLPQEARAWDQLSRLALRIFGSYGYEPIETPIFEQTDMFTRGIGEATDVVGKEMFQVLSKNAYATLLEGGKLAADQRLSLRPEGTASVVRAVQEHNLVPSGAAPAKLMYFGPMFRCERPQKGRLRQFHQIGAECLGAHEPSVDAEMIIMLMRFFEKAGVPRSNMRLIINSMGDDNCRPAYRDSVRDFILAHGSELCDECNRRAHTNPLRALDCKNPACKQVLAAAPTIDNALCDDCRAHYEAVKAYLDMAGIEYVEDPHLVRGLDYYTNTVFEVQVIDGLGSQNAIGGGGRYDKLMESVGGKPTPGIGFALGFERLMLALEAAGVQLGGGSNLDVFVACVDASMRAASFKVLQSLRDAGVRADADHQARSLKSQFKLADKLAAPLVVVVGPDEFERGEVTLRDMASKEQRNVSIEELPTAVKGLLGE